MLLNLKKDWGDIFNSSSIKMNSSSVASLRNPEENKKKQQKITSLFFSYLEPYPNQNLVIENSGMTMLSDQEYVTDLLWSEEHTAECLTESFFTSRVRGHATLRIID